MTWTGRLRLFLLISIIHFHPLDWCSSVEMHPDICAAECFSSGKFKEIQKVTLTKFLPSQLFHCRTNLLHFIRIYCVISSPHVWRGDSSHLSVPLFLLWVCMKQRYFLLRLYSITPSLDPFSVSHSTVLLALYADLRCQRNLTGTLWTAISQHFNCKIKPAWQIWRCEPGGIKICEVMKGVYVQERCISLGHDALKTNDTFRSSLSSMTDCLVLETEVKLWLFWPAQSRPCQSIWEMAFITLFRLSIEKIQYRQWCLYRSLYRFKGIVHSIINSLTSFI